MTATNSPTVRYFLLNGTYIDLELPYQKIGVPFEKSDAQRDVTLSNCEKTKIITELSKCETAIRAGDVEMLEFAVEICNRCAAPLPGWLLPYILEAINRLLRLKGRTRQERLQREIHQLRWAAVHHLRASQRLTWEDAYQAASRELGRTRARGSDETIRASYKWMNRHPIIKSLRQNGWPGEVDDFAREQYEKRQAVSDRMISLELRDKTKPKYRPGRNPGKL